MPSIILDDFFGDTKIELQLAHKPSVDEKNLNMIHKVFGEIVKLKKENQKLKEAEPTTDPIKDCMNDIINQVETREWKRVNDHRERVVKKMKNQSQKIENMKDDWAVATEKIGQENSDLHNEIKRLKKSHAETCSYWRIKVMSVEEENKCLKDEKIHLQTIYNGRYVKYENEIKLLKDVNKLHLQKLEHMEKSKSGIRYKELLDENEKLKNRIEDAEQRGFDEGRDQYQVDSEYLDEKVYTEEFEYAHGYNRIVKSKVIVYSFQDKIKITVGEIK